MKKYKILLIIIIVIGLMISTYYLMDSEKEKIIEEAPREEQMVGGQRDEHGCLVGGGYSWCEASQKCIRLWEDGCDDEIFKLSQAIKEETGINFVDQGEHSFNWLVRNDNQDIIQKSIEGRRMEVNGVDIEKLQEIETFFNDNGNQNMLNVADGVSAGLRGYTYHYMACLLSWQQEGSNADIQIDCGFFNK